MRRKPLILQLSRTNIEPLLLNSAPSLPVKNSPLRHNAPAGHFEQMLEPVAASSTMNSPARTRITLLVRVQQTKAARTRGGRKLRGCSPSGAHGMHSCTATSLACPIGHWSRRYVKSWSFQAPTDSITSV
eukprot:2627355-Rhodomonas_salina.2